MLVCYSSHFKMFEIEGKVALVTGGASGIGLETVKQILRNGAKGVTVADIDKQRAKIALEELTSEFGHERVIFVETDVANKESFEDAFKRTVATFKHIDILVNNAGIFDDKNYEREIAVNLTGVIHGVVLGLEKYITKYKSGAEGVIINTASVTGTRVYPALPIYGSTKSAVVSLTIALGNVEHYEKTKVKVVAIAPGFTMTEILRSLTSQCMNDRTCEMMNESASSLHPQTVDYVGKGIIEIIKEKPSGTVWIQEEEGELLQYTISVVTGG